MTSFSRKGILFALCFEWTINPDSANTKLLHEAAVEYIGKPIGLSPEGPKKALAPFESVKRRTLYGGPAPEESHWRISDLETTLEWDKRCVADLINGVEDASDNLEGTIDAILGENR